MRTPHADAASDAGVVTEVVPRTLASTTIGADGTDEWMSSRYAVEGERFVRLNMITTITGATAGADGTSNTITSRTDRFVLGAIRRHCDVVVVGAETVRAEGYVLPRTARLAIVTSTGDLGGRLSSKGREDRPPALVLCPESAAPGVRHMLRNAPAEVIPIPSDGDQLRPQVILAALHARGLSRVVCEGGPALATQFVSSGVVDEICVTISPALEPPRDSFIALPERADAVVAGMLVDEAGFSYLRLRMSR